MLIPGLNYKVIRPISPTIMGPIIEACSMVDWTQDGYGRKEQPLRNGKLIEFPFVLEGERISSNPYGEIETRIIEATKPLIAWMNKLYPKSLWLRGSLGALPPGATLDWHIDGGWHHPICYRYHIPIITNDGCKEMWSNDEVHMAVGYLYEFNNIELHSATNQGTDYRSHLIFDLIPESEWDDSTFPERAIKRKHLAYT